jgi:DAK2 domain fusion protein YloV
LGVVTERPRRVLNQCDGRQLLDVFSTATAWLAAHAAEVDALNVYPVPDGDTGSNMSQTMRAALAEAETEREVDAGKIAASLAHGALMGARGNSGVILSQLLRGFARALDGKRTFSPSDVANALQEGSATAYRAVVKPVEGTVLTVSRVAGEHAVQAAADQPNFQHVLGNALSAARVALKETRNQLPALRQAGVVDAGGQGYLLLIEGALRHLQGHRDQLTTSRPEPVASARATAPGHASLRHHESAFGYCTEFIIVGSELSDWTMRTELESMGDSLLVVGDGSLLRIHVHTDDPGRALTAAARLGRLRQVKVQDMQAQHDEFAREVPAASPTMPELPASSKDVELPVGIVAVANGDGFKAILENLGAEVVVGGQTMNPSTQQILDAVGRCPQNTVIILPNNTNVVSTAHQAASLSNKRVEVIPTQSIPQGIAALISVQYDEEIDQILDSMRAASNSIRTIEVTRAVRNAELDGLQVRKGEVLGILDGKLSVAGNDVESVVSNMFEALDVDHNSVVTVYAGDGTSKEAAEQLHETLERRYPQITIESSAGGQPHYQFIVSIE